MDRSSSIHEKKSPILVEKQAPKSRRFWLCTSTILFLSIVAYLTELIPILMGTSITQVYR